VAKPPPYIDRMMQKNATNSGDRPLAERARYIKHSDFFVAVPNSRIAAAAGVVQSGRSHGEEVAGAEPLASWT
jgi:hypothetical protein